jgi:hypothetical protein
MGAETKETAGHKPGGETPAEDHRQDQVTITINDVPKSIHRGRQDVSAIKKLGEVPLADVLEQKINGRLEPLADDGSLVIRGGEEFLSHPRDSGSSHA